MYYHNWDTQYNNLYIQYHKSPSFNHRQSNIYLYLITLLSIGIYHKLVLGSKKKNTPIITTYILNYKYHV